MTDPAIREATQADVEGITLVAEATWHAAYADVLNEETIDAALAEWYDPEATRELVARADVTYLVTEAEDEVVGYVSGGPTERGGVASLGAIYVAPEHWGEGIGTALYEALADQCRDDGLESIRVRVLEDNEMGRSFYRTHGFELVEYRNIELFDEEATECLYRRDL